MSIDITSQNAVIMLSVTGVFLAPIKIQGFAADDIFTVDAISTKELQMGLDGDLAAGQIPVAVPWHINLKANSPSMYVFDTWNGLEKMNKTVYAAYGTVSLPALGQKWTMSKGFLTNFKPMSDAAKVLQKRSFTITWQSVSPSLI